LGRQLLEKTIAKNIRALRKVRKMTLQDVENLTGLSKGYLSKVERGLKFPPFSTIGQIAGALGVEVAFLLKDNLPESPDSRISLTLSGQGKKAQTLAADRGYRFEALASGKPGKNMIPYIIEVAPQEEQVFSHEGEEFLYVLEGEMEFVYDDQTFLMKQGDSVYFESAVPHSGRSIGKGKTRLLAVMYNYKRL
jgi:transcriptional regulator with XRE-family HTH domain